MLARRFLQALVLFMFLFGVQMIIFASMTPVRSLLPEVSRVPLRVLSASTRLRTCCSDSLLYGDAQLCAAAREEVEVDRQRRIALKEAERNKLDSLGPAAEWVDPQTAISPRRFDLVAKYLFADGWYRQIYSPYRKHLYAESIRVFNEFKEICSHRYSKDTYTFTHHDCQDKIGEQAFVDSFERTLSSICQTGMIANASSVPMHYKANEDGSHFIWNGAHRVAATLAFGQILAVVATNRPERAQADEIDSYNFMWFREKGLDESLLTDMALSFASSLAPGILLVLGCEGFEHEHVTTAFGSQVQALCLYLHL